MSMEESLWRHFRTNMSENLPLGFLRIACDEITVHVEEANPQEVKNYV